MDNNKKILLVVFAMLLMMNLQFNTILTKGMDDGFSMAQLMENIFVQESYAEGNSDVNEMCVAVGCPGGDYFCAEIYFPSNNTLFCSKPNP